MGDLIEVAISSNGSSTSTSSSSIVLWDYRTGTNLKTYKNSENINPHNLSFIKNEYLICTDNARPALKIWTLNNSNPLGTQVKSILPGFANALAIDPFGHYCVCGIGDKIYIWQLASGRLLAIGEEHFQRIVCIKFLDNGVQFVSAGEDGVLVLWSLATLSRKDEKIKPEHIFSEHSAPVTDIYVGHGRSPYLVSVSMDKTLRFYRLIYPALLFTFVFDVHLSSVKMNNCETKLFVGLYNGDIQELSLREPPRTETHITTKESKLKFIGHTDRVNSISVSCSATYLLSGGNDKKIILWDIISRQPIRSIIQQCSITNVSFQLASKNFFSTFDPIIKIMDFERTVNHSSPYVITKMITEEIPSLFSLLNSKSSSSSEDKQLREEISRLKKSNKSLYQFSVNHLINKSENS